MCILFKFDFAKFGASNLCFSKVIEERPLRVGPGTGRVNLVLTCILPKNLPFINSHIFQLSLKYDHSNQLDEIGHIEL